jgi:hypothetical protein
MPGARHPVENTPRTLDSEFLLLVLPTPMPIAGFAARTISLVARRFGDSTNGVQTRRLAQRLDRFRIGDNPLGIRPNHIQA